VFNRITKYLSQQKYIQNIPWKGVSSVLLVFILTRGMVFIVTYLSMIEIPVNDSESFWRSTPQNIIADGMVRWDSGYYRDIASRGYESVVENNGLAFFPMYPVLVRFFYNMTGRLNLSGLLLSNLMFLVALGYLYGLVKLEYKDEDIASRTIFYLAAAPSAYIFSAMYSESTFLAFLVASFYYARKRRWLLAALLGAAATATRAPGIAIALFILTEGFLQKGVSFSFSRGHFREQIELIGKNIWLMLTAWQSNLAAVASTFGLWIYMAYLDKVFGDPLAFIHMQSNWGRSMSGNFLINLIQNTYHQLKFGGNLLAGQINANVLQDTLAALVFIPLVILVLVKMRFSYGLYSLVTWLIPLLSSSILSMRRFVLMLVPCYILLAIWGKRPWVDRLIIAVSLPLQAYLTILFTHWYFAG
jgi:hypothetical protein